MLEEDNTNAWANKAKQQSSLKKTNLLFNFYKSEMSSDAKFPLK